MTWDAQTVINVVTVAAAIVGLTVGYFDLRKRLDRLLRDDRHYLSDFSNSLSEITDPAGDRRKDAEAIKKGTGPETWTAGGVTVRKDQVFYVNELKRNDEVVTREGTRERDSCVLLREGTLTVLGFSESRRAALVRYEPPEGDSPGGTACVSGAEMFYPMR